MMARSVATMTARAHARHRFRVGREGPDASLSSAAETSGPYPRNALLAPNHAKQNLPMVPAPRRTNPKAGALEAAKNVAASMAVALHAWVEAHCCRLHADLAESTEFAPFRSRCFEPGLGSILRA